MIRLRMMLIGAAVVFATSPCQVAAQKADDDSVLVSTAWLAKHLSDPKLVVLYVGHDTADAKGDHIPGSRFVSYMDITAQRDGLGTELPPVDKLKELFLQNPQFGYFFPRLTTARLFANLAFLQSEVARLQGRADDGRLQPRTV